VLGLVFNGDSGRGARYQDRYYAPTPAKGRAPVQWFSRGK
jgi:hypothetical protein